MSQISLQIEQIENKIKKLNATLEYLKVIQSIEETKASKGKE